MPKKSQKKKAPPTVVVGKYLIIELESGKIWLQRVNGEGMETTAAELESLLDEFWAEGF